MLRVKIPIVCKIIFKLRVTMFYIEKTDQNRYLKIWCGDRNSGYKSYNKLCFKCVSYYDLMDIPESQHKLSGGLFKCPANSCVCWMSFESFIKRECCDAARHKRIEELFSQTRTELQNVKTSSSGKKIRYV